MTRELQDDGFAIGRRRTARLMRENGLRGRQKRRFKRTTDSEHAWPIAPNIIDQDFTARAPNRKWGVDISYVWAREGWLYLTVVIDLFSRRVIGWAVGDHLHRDLALAALRKALVIRHPPEGLIRTAEANIVRWTTGPNCAATASASPSQAREIATIMRWSRRSSRRSNQSSSGAPCSILVTTPRKPFARSIDGFYNPVRRHSALDYISPAQFERTVSPRKTSGA
jgi:putative transposase